MRRAIAAAAAIAMVGAAIVIRAGLDDHAETAKAPIRLTCVPELAVACRLLADSSDEKIAVTVEAPATTALTLTGLADDATPPIDAWFATQPWASIVEGGRQRDGRTSLLEVAAQPVARTPLVLVAWKDRAAAFETACGGELSWTCLGDKADQPWSSTGGEQTWGRVKIGHGDPTTDSTAVLAIGQAVARWFADAERPTPAASLSAADLENDDTFAARFDRLERAVHGQRASGSVESLLVQMLSQGRSAYDVVATTEAESASQFAANPTQVRNVDVLYPSPTATADARVAFVRTSTVRSRAKKALAADALAVHMEAEKWRTRSSDRPVEAAAAAPPSLPSSNGLPNDGLLENLLKRAKEKT